MVKGILKHYSLPNMNRSEDSDATSSVDPPTPKRVSFDGAELVRVFRADEWDRSPAEVTLKLTYKDVMELRELNVSLIRTGPLAMERTSSQRPTRQRTPVPQSPPPINAKSSPMQLGSPSITAQVVVDKPTACPSSPVFGMHTQPASPPYQYQAFFSQSLPPLLEDAAAPTSAPSPLEHRNRGNGLSPSDAYFEYYSMSQSGSPPGLPLRMPLHKGLASPTLAPPSPLRLSSPLPSRPPSPKPTSPSMSPVPLYSHPRARSRPSSLKNHGTTDALMSVRLPSLTRRASVPDKFSFDKLTFGTEHITGPSPTWKPMDLAGTVIDSSSLPSLFPNKDADAHNALSHPPTPVIMRKTGRSLMGWELKRSSNAYGKLGFGLVRKQGA